MAKLIVGKQYGKKCTRDLFSLGGELVDGIILSTALSTATESSVLDLYYPPLLTHLVLRACMQVHNYPPTRKECYLAGYISIILANRYMTSQSATLDSYIGDWLSSITSLEFT